MEGFADKAGKRGHGNRDYLSSLFHHRDGNATVSIQKTSVCEL